MICDASDYTVGVVLGQQIDKKPHVIYYASHTSNDVVGCKISMTNQIVLRGKKYNNSSSHKLPPVRWIHLLKFKCG